MFPSELRINCLEGCSQSTEDKKKERRGTSNAPQRQSREPKIQSGQTRIYDSTAKRLQLDQIAAPARAGDRRTDPLHSRGILLSAGILMIAGA